MAYQDEIPYWEKTANFFAVKSKPLQELFVKTGFTHSFCIIQAIRILTSDGLEDFAQRISDNMMEIEQGILWADSAFKSSMHFYNPVNKRGYLHFCSAADEGKMYWEKAMSSWRIGAFKKAYFYLGACAHLVQDMCVPHHSRILLLDGHQDYENWAEAHCSSYSVNQFGDYGIGNSLEQWIHHNAVISSDFYNQVKKGANESKFHLATSELLPLAQQTTAGFLACFFWQMLDN